MGKLFFLSHCLRGLGPPLILGVSCQRCRHARPLTPLLEQRPDFVLWDHFFRRHSVRRNSPQNSPPFWPKAYHSGYIALGFRSWHRLLKWVPTTQSQIPKHPWGVFLKKSLNWGYLTPCVMNAWLLCALRSGLNMSLPITQWPLLATFEFSIACDLETFCQHGDK